MSDASQLQKMAAMMDKAIRRGYPTAVHLVTEQNAKSLPQRVSLLNCPRFSLCLSASARYQIVREGRLVDVTLKRGEAIAVAPNAVMEPHPASRYLAMGLVFAPELTRFLLARKKPDGQTRRHQFLLSYHSPEIMDEELRFFWSALERRGGCGRSDKVLCGLLQLIMIKSREMLDQEAPGSRKASFTWQAACQFVQEHLHHGIGRDDVAQFLNLHPNHVSRLFSQFGGGSFNQYLLNARLQRARVLLQNPAMNVGDVARACGFAEANYFIRCYRKSFGITPGRSRSRGL